MKIHRVRKAKNIDEPDKPYLFVEFEQDLWMEVKKRPTHESIEDYNKAIHEEGKQHGLPMYSTRSFDIGIIQDWTEEEPIQEY